MNRYELLVERNGTQSIIHFTATAWDVATHRWSDLFPEGEVLAWRPCQCPSITTLGNPDRIIG
jgi:hypothetical protein